MPDQNMTERELSAEQITNQSDTKAARLEAYRDDSHATEAPRPEQTDANPPREIAVAGPQEVTSPGPQGIVPAGPTDITPSEPPEIISADPPPVIPVDPVDTSGPEIIIEGTHTRRRRRKPLLPILAAVAAVLVLAMGLCAWLHFDSYDDAVYFAEEGRYTRARNMLFLPGLTRLHDSQFLDYLEGGEQLNAGNYDSAESLLQPLASAGYRDADQLLLEINYNRGCDAIAMGSLKRGIDYLAPLARQGYRDSWTLYCEARISYGLEMVEHLTDIDDVVDGLGLLRNVSYDGYYAAADALHYASSIVYDYAVSLYEQDNLPDALNYFTQVQSYGDSRKYIVLCNTYWYTTTVEELWELRGFANADELMLTQYYLCEFLLGTWRTSNNYYYYTMEANTGMYAYYCTYNIPWQYTGDFEIVDGVYRVFHNGGNTSLSEFRISIDSWNQITIYAYKNGGYYTLYRK